MPRIVPAAHLFAGSPVFLGVPYGLDAGRTDGQAVRCATARSQWTWRQVADEYGRMITVDRTDRRLLLAIRLFVLPGIFAAAYLTYGKMFDKSIQCGGGCEVIQLSHWSELFGVPVTLVGVITYVLIFISTFLKNDLGKLSGAFLATVGAAFSIWLQYQALFVMEHFCPYCFTSAVCMQVLAALTITRVLRLPKYEDPSSSGKSSDLADALT